LTSARESFRRNELLLIGANGFLGKVILGLLLDRFPDFKHLHILVRPKRKLSSEERFEKDVLASPSLASIVEKRGPELVREKITILTGDVGQPDCGLDEETLEEMSGRIGLVLNCAGLVDFFPPVDDSFQSNVDGVENVVALTKRLGAKLVHVSTCFVCGEADGFIEESEPILGFYPRRKGPRDGGFRHDQEIRYMRERIREAYAAGGADGGRGRSKELAQKLIDLGWQRAAQWGWVNTYTYAKSLGEQLIAAEEELDYTIVRPAIVEAALRFPFPGWVEGGRTAAPLVMMAMSGLRHWTVREEAPLEVVPVDLVAASILIAGVLLLNGSGERVYHVSTADVNPVYFGPLVEILYREYRRQRRSPRNRRRQPLWLRTPLGPRIVSPERSRARCKRQQRRLVRLRRLAAGMRRLLERAGLPGGRSLRGLAVALRSAGLHVALRDQALQLYQPFLYDNRFVFEAENIRAAYARLSDEDRELLPWIPEKIDWKDYWVNNEVRGVQKWVWSDAPKEKE
jgi:long-chain acyl-CoA synthetase